MSGIKCPKGFLMIKKFTSLMYHQITVDLTPLK